MSRSLGVQESVATCMEEAGFDYVPAVPPPSVSELPPQGARPGTAAFAEEFGYGLVWSVENRPDALAWEDPNSEIRARLSAAAAAEYDAALWGSTSAAPGVDGQTPDYDWRQAGCMGKAQHEVDPQSEAFLDPDSLQQEIALLDDEVLQDQRVVDALTDWSVCMREAGYPDLASPDDAPGVLVAQLAQYISPMEDGDGVVVTDPAGLEDLASEETAMAVADVQCRESVQLDQVESEARVAAEEHFMELHGAELEVWAQEYFGPTT